MSLVSNIILKIIQKLTFCAVVMAALLLVGTPGLQAEVAAGAMARMAPPMPPQPPQQNPHPPQTPADRRRVAFAEQAIRLHLMNSPSQDYLPRSAGIAQEFQNKDLACLRLSVCYSQDQAYVVELWNLHRQYGPLVEMRHGHIIPWSWQRFQKVAQEQLHPQQPLDPNVIVEAQVRPVSHNEVVPAQKPMGPKLKADEYMVHLYVRFGKNPRWHHLDVILTEDEQGNIGLRHFYTIPMPVHHSSLPPGVVC